MAQMRDLRHYQKRHQISVSLENVTTLRSLLADRVTGLESFKETVNILIKMPKNNLCYQHELGDTKRRGATKRMEKKHLNCLVNKDKKRKTGHVFKSKSITPLVLPS